MHTVGHLHMHNYIMNDVLPVYEVRRFKTCRNVTVLIELYMCKWLIVCILFVICIPYRFGTSPLLSYPFCSSDWPIFSPTFPCNWHIPFYPTASPSTGPRFSHLENADSTFLGNYEHSTATFRNPKEHHSSFLY